MKDIIKKLLSTLTFTDLPIRNKFILFSSGALFWLIVIASIGLVFLFDMNAKSNKMVDVIVSQERTANIAIRKLRGANVSMHNIVIHHDREFVSANYRRVRGTLNDSRSYLDILLKGGQIADHVRATGQIHTPFLVVPEFN